MTQIILFPFIHILGLVGERMIKIQISVIGKTKPILQYQQVSIFIKAFNKYPTRQTTSQSNLSHSLRSKKSLMRARVKNLLMMKPIYKDIHVPLKCKEKWLCVEILRNEITGLLISRKLLYYKLKIYKQIQMKYKQQKFVNNKVSHRA